jgi:hypothetical protein
MLAGLTLAEAGAADCGAVALSDLRSIADLRGWAVVSSDGTFRRVREFVPGAIDAQIMLVRSDDDDRCVVDAVAWAIDDPDSWWTWSGKVLYLGEDELRRARWDDDRAYLVSRPVDFLNAHGRAVCLIRWDADIDSILAGVRGVTCDTSALAARLRRIWVEQATEHWRRAEAAARRFPITVGRPPIAR